jgi:MFS family permease
LVRLVLTVSALFVAIGGPLAGFAADRWGRKPLLVVVMMLHGLAGTSGVLAVSLAQLLVGRALLGLAVAGIITATTTLAADYYIGRARAQFMGLQNAFMGLGGVVFLVMSGLLADLGWRLPFLVHLLAFAILPLVLLALNEPQRTGQFTGAAGTSQGEKDPKAPYLPVGFLATAYCVVLLMQVVFNLIPTQLPFHLRALFDANATQSGIAIAVNVLFTSAAALQYGRVSSRLSYTQVVAVGFGLIGAGYAGVALADTYGFVLVGMAVSGLGFGLLIPNMNVWVAARTPEALRGRALGGLAAFLFLGQFLSPLISQPLSSQLGLAAVYGLAGGLMLFLALGVAWLFANAPHSRLPVRSD